MSDNKLAIWPPYEVFYIHSMLFCTKSAVTSIERICDALEKISKDTSEAPLANLDSEDILNNFQNIVVQGAALSRYFWPVRKGHENRAKFLRETLCVDDNNPLKSRDLRNEIEHFDEKLDYYLSNKIIVGNIFPQYVGPLPKNNGVSIHIFRAYYVDVGLFEMLGKRYEMEPISDEIYRLHDMLNVCAENGGRLQQAQGLKL